MTTLMTQQQLHFVQVSPQKPLWMTLNFKLQTSKDPKRRNWKWKITDSFFYLQDKSGQRLFCPIQTNPLIPKKLSFPYLVNHLNLLTKDTTITTIYIRPFFKHIYTKGKKDLSLFFSLSWEIQNSSHAALSINLFV